MKEERQDFANVVEQIMKVPSVPKEKWWSHIEWRKQLMVFVNLIPSVGGAIATEIETILDSASNYQAYQFFRKFSKFICSLGNVTEEEKLKFLMDLEKEGHDSSGNIILTLVDRLDNINKEMILANLVESRVHEKITMDDFFRLSSIIERIPFVDLKHLPRYQEDFYDEDGDTELLYSTGVLRPSRFHSSGDKYILSPLGVKLMKYGLKTTVDVPNIKGTSAGISWDEVGDITDSKGMEDVVNQVIEKRIYDESDQAMFDYDLLRGK